MTRHRRGGGGGPGPGAAGPRQPVEVHAAAHLINAALGAIGNTLAFIADPQPQRPPHAEALRGLAAAVAAGEVTTLLVLGGNPVANAPVDLGFAALLARVPTSNHLGLWDDETGRACSWHVPRAHVFESWGDARVWDGTVSVVQPLIEPLYGGLTPIELVAALLGDASARPYELVRATLRELVSGDFEATWARTLHDGVLAGSAPAPTAVQAVTGGLAMPQPLTGLEVVFAGNLSNGAPDLLRDAIPRLLAGESLAPPALPERATEPIDEQTLRRYEGDFMLESGNRLRVRARGGALWVNDWPLVPTRDGAFFSPRDYGLVRGIEGADGRIERLDWTQRGKVYPGPGPPGLFYCRIPSSAANGANSATRSPTLRAKCLPHISARLCHFRHFTNAFVRANCQPDK